MLPTTTSGPYWCYYSYSTDSTGTWWTKNAYTSYFLTFPISKEPKEHKRMGRLIRRPPEDGK